jgi:hypothetical protein
MTAKWTNEKITGERDKEKDICGERYLYFTLNYITK